MFRLDNPFSFGQFVEVDEGKGERNLSANMRLLGKETYIASPSRLKKFIIPDFEPKSNDLNLMAGTPIKLRINEKNIKRSYVISGEVATVLESASIDLGISESNMVKSEENQISSSEFDVSDNEAFSPLEDQRAAPSKKGWLSRQSSFANIPSSIVETSACHRVIKTRCHSLLPRLAERYFSESKDDQNNFELQLSMGTSLINIHENSANLASTTAEQHSKKEYSRTSINQIDEVHWENNLESLYSQKQPRASVASTQLAQHLPESLLDGSKFNINFNQKLINQTPNSNQNILQKEFNPTGVSTSPCLKKQVQSSKEVFTAHICDDGLVQNQKNIEIRNFEGRQQQSKVGGQTQSKSPTLKLGISSLLEFGDECHLTRQANNSTSYCVSAHSQQIPIRSSQKIKNSQDYLENSLRVDTTNLKRSLFIDPYYDKLTMPRRYTQQTQNTIDVRIESERSIKLNLSVIIEHELHTQLIQAIFENNLKKIQEAILRIDSEDRFSVLNRKDQKGNTPILLAAMLPGSVSQKQQIIKVLLKHDADPRIRDENGWSCFDEVAWQKNQLLAQMFFDNLVKRKCQTLLEKKREIDNMLSDVPDFYLEMKWEFQSNFIPFVSRIAPSDTFKIWKFGRSIRCDSTFAGLQKFTTKRRAQSLIFNSLNIKDKLEFSQTSDFDFLTIFHKQSKTFHLPLEEVDGEETKKILNDLLCGSENIEGRIIFTKSTITPNKTLFGSQNNSKISGYKCSKFDLRLQYRLALRKKNRVPLPLNYEGYIGYASELSPTKIVCSLSGDNEFKDMKTENNRVKELQFTGGINQSGHPMQFSLKELNENQKIEDKKQTLGLYISEDFPMKFGVLLPLLEFLSNGNQLLSSFIDVFKEQQLREIVCKNGFPVRLQVPINYSIFANITFSSFK